jgi:PhzF family phenazine biosynthesis protein
MSEIPIFIVDAFTGTLNGQILRGNPAAVVLLETPRDDLWMQNVAAEMNLSETAFLFRQSESTFHLRWLTPTAEVKLCGHATLASAHVLWEQGILASMAPAHFHTLSGLLTAHQQDGWIELDFPTQKVKIAAAPDGLAQALGIKSQTPVSYWKAEDDWLLELPMGQVEVLRPNFSWLREISQKLNCRGFIVTSASTSAEYDFVSRFFGPAVGVDEDPVTGSAHTKLAPFWGAQLKKTEVVGYQASARGGLVRCQWRDARVGLRGQAITFLKGRLA